VLACALLLYVTGVCFTVWSANSQSILQLSAPDHLRGRVLSLYIISFGGLAPVGGLVAGWLAEVGGLSLAFGVAGLTGLAGAGLLVASRGRVVGTALPRPNISSITD
jgi:MFS family permease